MVSLTSATQGELGSVGNYRRSVSIERNSRKPDWLTKSRL